LEIDLLKVLEVDGPLVNGRYLHWDELRHRKPPKGLTLEQWWFGLKIRRQSSTVTIPLLDKAGMPFSYLLVDPVPENLHQIDKGAGAWIGTSSPIMNTELSEQYYVRSLMEEAITSSQLEGAATTRRVAKEMLRSGRPARDRSEQMILNNYETMLRLRELEDKPLTTNLLFELHSLITHDTLDDPGAAGRFRNGDEDIVVSTQDGVVLHTPPPASELPDRVQTMCDFANEDDGRPRFIHPVLRAIILHFWLAYDHPFVDGNGRAARALFYWLMMRKGYWLFQFVSISEIILKGPAKYSRSFLYTETDANDLTYFINYHLDVIKRSVKELRAYIEHKSMEVAKVEAAMKALSGLNHRQEALLAHAMRHPGFRYTIAGHKTSHRVVYQTARTDLLALSERGLLEQFKVGRTLYFSPVPDLDKRLHRLASKRTRSARKASG
jgi:Fic family protein